MTCLHRKAYRDLPASPRFPVTRAQCVECGEILNPYRELSSPEYHAYARTGELPPRLTLARLNWEALKYGEVGS